jgi:hypothetical protein
MIAWLVVPVVVVALSGGLGLLVESASRSRLSWPTLVAVGMSALIVVTTFVTAFPAIATYSPFVAIALAVTGAVLGRARIVEAHGSRWPVIVAVAVYAVYSLPVAPAGATFAGFIKLDDTADWMVLGDRLARFGYSLEGLGSGTGDTFLSLTFAGGYPVGAFADLGVVSRLVGIDSAFVIQPLMSALAAGLGLALYAATEGVVRSSALRAGVAVLASCSTLLLGYVMWGGLKEITLAMLLATCTAVLTQGRDDTRPLLGQAATFAVPMSAVIVVFGVAGAVHLALLAIAEVAIVAWAYGWRRVPGAAGVFLGVFAVLAIPTWKLLSLQLELARTSTLTGAQDIGNLFGPLKFVQIFGVWLTGDFRELPSPMVLTELLVLVVLLGAVGGVVVSVRARRPRVPVFAVMSLLVGVVSVFGNAWLEGKVLAVASPAMLLAAGVAFAWVVESGRRWEGMTLIAVMSAGVLVSTTLTYRDVFLAPSDRMQELSTIGQGDFPTPALLLEYSAAAARHFLVPLDAQGAGELRRDVIPTYDGQGVGKGDYADIDSFPVSSIAPFRTLVLRNALVASRPPSTYDHARAGTFYNVWVALGTARPIIQHWPLGSLEDPAAAAPCPTVRAAITAAGTNGRIAVVHRAPVIVIPLDTNGFPPGWSSGSVSGAVSATSNGSVTTTFAVPAEGDYHGDLGGSVNGRATLVVDGAEWTTVQGRLNWAPNVNPLSTLHLAAGQHTLTVTYQTTWLPGGGYTPSMIGPLVLSTQRPDPAVEYVAPSAALTLCGQRLDWIEAVAG